MKKTLFWLVIGFFLIGVVAGLLIYRKRGAETATPKRGEIVEAIYALGKVKARRQFELKIGILSTVERVFVREGQVVKAQSPLIKMTDSGIFRAPYDGIVTLVNVDEGEPAAPNVPVLRLDDDSDKYIEVSLEQQGALRVQTGQKAEIVFESLRGEKLQGKVASLFSRNDEFLAHIEVDGGLKPNVLPGMTADVAITIGRRDNTLLIPVSAVSNGFVIAVRDGKRRKVPVQIGAVDGQMAEVVGGDITENDQVVVGSKK